jgi:hypothetical protein
MYYTGIGSRETPENILKLFTNIARKLSNRNWTLRSGGAEGADTSFEIGACSKEIYLPWKGFNGSSSSYYCISKSALTLACQLHPAWDKIIPRSSKTTCKETATEILGYDLQSPSEFVICWTQGGMGKGGTGQAIRLARKYEIPIIDFGKDTIQDNLSKIKNFLTTRKSGPRLM